MTFEEVLTKALRRRAIVYLTLPSSICKSCCFSINAEEHIENDMELIVEKLLKEILND